MLNTASALQNFRQAQQLNPLELERAQEVVKQAKTTTEKTALQLQQDHANIAKSAIAALTSSKHFQPNENGEYNKEAMLQDLHAVERMVKAQGVKSSPGGAADILRRKIDDNPAEAAQFLQTIAIDQLSPESKVGLIKPGNVTVGGVPALQNQLTGEIRPGKIVGDIEAPKMDLKAKPPAPEYASELAYPVRKPNQPFIPNPSETVALQQGQAYRKSLQDINNPQVLPKMKRDLVEVDKKVDEIAQKAIDLGWANSRTGIWGALTRKTAEVLGNPDYQQLSKDIANLQISQLKSSGGSMQTDQGKALQEHANGNATYSPEVLKNIIGRVTSDVTNNELQQIAADKFARRFGDQNIATFQKQWNANAGDGKVFEAWYINNTLGDKDPKKADAMIHELLGKPKTKEFDDNLNRLQNIEDLINYGYISKRK
jgi:hypothetical protein